MFELYQLQQFVAVAENETISAAADALFTSHSTLSRTIRKLESELGVELFERSRNRMVLNENGKIALSEAKKVLEQAKTLEEKVRFCDMSRRTLSIGACAPAPLWDISPILSALYPKTAIRTELCDVEYLEPGLYDEKYQMIITPLPTQDDQMYCKKWGEERLFFSLPLNHTHAAADRLKFSDLDGETMLLFAEIGCWKHICEQKMPHSHFIMEKNMIDFQTLVSTTSLPVFQTNLSLKIYGTPEGRVNVPIYDEKSTADFYCICLGRNRGRLKEFFKILE